MTLPTAIGCVGGALLVVSTHSTLWPMIGAFALGFGVRAYLDYAWPKNEAN